MSLVLLLLRGGGAAPDRPGGHCGVGWDAGAHGEVGGEGRGKWIRGPVGIDCGWGQQTTSGSWSTSLSL